MATHAARRVGNENVKLAHHHNQQQSDHGLWRSLYDTPVHDTTIAKAAGKAASQSSPMHASNPLDLPWPESGE